MTDTNRRVLLKSRPQGRADQANFDVVDAPVPEPKDGEYLSRTIWLSLDPYMRGRMSRGQGLRRQRHLGDAMVGGTVGQVIEVQAPRRSRQATRSSSIGGWQSTPCRNGALR